jgi:hypothetical protein
MSIIQETIGFNNPKSFDYRMQSKVILTSVLIFSVTLLGISTAYAQDSVSFDTFSIGIETENGYIADGEFEFSGTVSPITSDSIFQITWSIYRSDGLIVDGGDINSNSGANYELGTYLWNVQLNSSHYSSCACYFSITVSDDNNYETSLSIVFFVANEENSQIGLTLESPSYSDWVSNEILIEGWVGSLYQNQEKLYGKLNRINNIGRSCLEFDNTVDFEIIPDESSGAFSDIIDISSKLEGWHDLILFVSDEVEGEFEILSCIPVKMNNLVPFGSIISVSNIVESNDIELITSDFIEPYWSDVDLYYIWSVTDSYGNLELIEGLKIDSISIDLSQSGIFQLNLLVIDAGGQSVSVQQTIVIENIPPIANLTIDSEPIIDGMEIKLTDSEEWHLAANEYDTSNDISKLRCSWSINDVPVFEGCERILTWPDSSNDHLFLRLDVMDDDGEFDSINVKLINPNASKQFPYHIVVLIISSAFFIFSLFHRSKSNRNNQSIPKWNVKK